jgi:hypothetical protein
VPTSRQTSPGDPSGGEQHDHEAGSGHRADRRIETVPAALEAPDEVRRILLDAR